MKKFSIIKSGVIAAFIICCGNAVLAQSVTTVENNKEGYGAQLKKGTVPGLVFATSKSAQLSSQSATASSQKLSRRPRLASDSQAVKVKPPIPVKTTIPAQQTETH